MIRNPIQNEDSFKEQKLAITTCVNAIDQYIDPSHDDYVKNVGIRGFPGAGKTWCMMYCKLYAMSKGLKVTTTAIMCKRALQLGGTHLDKLFKIQFDDSRCTPHRRDKLAVTTRIKK